MNNKTEKPIILENHCTCHCHIVQHGPDVNCRCVKMCKHCKPELYDDQAAEVINGKFDAEINLPFVPTNPLPDPNSPIGSVRRGI